MYFSSFPKSIFTTQICLKKIQDQGPRTKDQGSRIKDQGPRTKDQGPRTKDHGPCFGTNEHPRRDTDVILRLSKSTIEYLSFYIGFAMELVVKMNIPRRQQYCSRFGIPFEYPSNQNTSYPDYPMPPPYSLASNPGSFPYPDQGFVQHPQAPYQPQYQRQPPTAPSNHPAYQTKY